MNRPIDEHMELFRKNIGTMEFILLSTIDFSAIPMIPPEKIIANFAKKYNLLMDFVEPQTALVKTLFYLTDISVKYSMDHLVAGGVFIFMKLNSITLEDQNSLPWYSHICRSIDFNGVVEICNYFFECNEKVSDKIKETVLRSIQVNFIGPFGGLCFLLGNIV